MSLSPQDADAHNNLGITLKDTGRFDEAERSYLCAISLRPNYAEAYNNLGNLLQQLGRLDQSAENYMEALTFEPTYAQVHSNLGVTFTLLGRLDEAEARCRQAIALRPDYVEAYINLGQTLKELGRLEEAVAIISQALMLRPDYAVGHHNLALTLQQLDRLPEAESSYLRALELDNNYTECRNNLLRCLYLLEKESLFFDQLDFLINHDEVNALIGSLTCRSELKYGVKKQNLFCRAPLGFVSHVNLNTQYQFDEIFVANVKSILSNNRISNRKQGLLINGYQTSGNIFARENELTISIEKVIRLEIEKYRLNFKDSNEGFIREWPADYNVYGWLVSMSSGGELKPHIHSGSWISGSIYINVPPKSNANSGNLVVSIGDDKDPADIRLNLRNIIDVVTGSLVLFPGSITHYTIPFESDQERVVLAFDIIKNE